MEQKVPIEITSVAIQMGFKVGLASSLPNDDKGVLLVGEVAKEVYGKDKVILINKYISPRKRRYVLANELGVYKYDYDKKAKDFKHIYKEETGLENRAALYAINLLLPKEEFIRDYKNERKEKGIYSLVEYLAEKYNVPQNCILKRMEDLGIN